MYEVYDGYRTIIHPIFYINQLKQTLAGVYRSYEKAIHFIHSYTQRRDSIPRTSLTKMPHHGNTQHPYTSTPRPTSCAAKTRVSAPQHPGLAGQQNSHRRQNKTFCKESLVLFPEKVKRFHQGVNPTKTTPIRRLPPNIQTFSSCKFPRNAKNRTAN